MKRNSPTPPSFPTNRATSTGSVNWIAAGRGLWVASRYSAAGGLDHLGRIERDGEAFHAFDAFNRDLGVFATLPQAQRRVDSAPTRFIGPLTSASTSL